VTLLLAAKQIDFHLCKDQTIFNAQEVVKDDGKPYTVFTPFRNRWRNRLESHHYAQLPSESTGHFLEQNAKPIPSLAEIGFRPGQMPFPERKIHPEIIENTTCSATCRGGGNQSPRSAPALWHCFHPQLRGSRNTDERDMAG
jgi:hypothetical protein